MQAGNAGVCGRTLFVMLVMRPTMPDDESIREAGEGEGEGRIARNYAAASPQGKGSVRRLYAVEVQLN